MILHLLNYNYNNDTDTFTAKNNESLVSIIRREIAEKVLKLFSDKKLFVIDIFVGPYILRPILNIIDPLLKTINLGAYQVQLSDRKINTCISKEFKGEEVISERHQKDYKRVEGREEMPSLWRKTRENNIKQTIYIHDR